MASQTKHLKSSYFSVAKVSQDLEIFRFYGNENPYKNFYCPSGQIYPTLEQMEGLPFFRLIFENYGDYRSETYWNQFFQDLGKKEGYEVLAIRLYEGESPVPPEASSTPSSKPKTRESKRPAEEKTQSPEAFKLYALSYSCNKSEVLDQLEYLPTT